MKMSVLKLWPFRFLNCSVIEGTVEIDGSERETVVAALESVVQITGSLIVSGEAATVGNIFPRLAVIRRSLEYRTAYGQIGVYTFRHGNGGHRGLGLWSLTHVLGGRTVLWENPNLVYGETVDWESLSQSNAQGVRRCNGSCKGTCWKENTCQNRKSSDKYLYAFCLVS